MITWRPIAELPDELKDGREVLFAFEYANATVNPGPPHWLYSTGLSYDGGWVFEDAHWYAVTPHQPTHFAEINAPCG